MYEELLSKTNVDPKEEINTFFESDNDEPILVKDIQFYSLCEHHMLPFYGVCHIAYVPNNKKITGLSKLARLVESASRRLQIQEDMTLMLVNAIEEQLQPKGVYVIIEAEHMCMAMRGIKKIGSKTVTSKKTGIFLEDTELVKDIQYKIKLQNKQEQIMKESSYIIIRAEVDNVKVITKKTNNEEALEILNKGEVIILNIFDNIVNFKVQGRARIVSNLDQVISE